MASKIFLDANILLNFFLKRDYYNDAKKLIQFIIEKSCTVLLPWLSYILLHIG